MVSDPTLRLPSEWEQLTGIRILDGDGWDRRNWDVSWNTPIDEEEWTQRMVQSTCGPLYRPNKTV